MTQTQTAGPSPAEERLMAMSPHDQWIRTLGVPIHRGYFVEDVRTVELGWWPERECNAAFLQLAGQEGITEARVTEIPPGKTLPPLKFALDEIVYVADGRGLATVSGGGNQAPRTFEWQKHSMFLLPHSHTVQLTNTQGDRPVRLLHQNYLPLAMLTLADGVTVFLQKNRMYEVLGLFILLIVGVVLLGEAGPAAAHAMQDQALQIRILGHDLIPMSKTTFYFSVLVLVAVEVIQSGYSRKLAAERRAQARQS